MGSPAKYPHVSTFVSFCCMHLYFMFAAVSYQMFLRWCSFMYPHCGFWNKPLDLTWIDLTWLDPKQQNEQGTADTNFANIFSSPAKYPHVSVQSSRTRKAQLIPTSPTRDRQNSIKTSLDIHPKQQNQEGTVDTSFAKTWSCEVQLNILPQSSRTFRSQ